MRPSFIIIKLLDLIKNLTKSPHGLSYVIENAHWAIRHNGDSMAAALNQLSLISARVTSHSYLLHNQIVHFGSEYVIPSSFLRRSDSSNRYGVSLFHIDPSLNRVNFILSIQTLLSYIHTACNKTKEILVSYGLDPQKIHVIPLGVDLKIFQPLPDEKKRHWRQSCGIPANRFIIGSFQKDGVGWGQGLEPKHIKGPDILVSVLKNISKHIPIHVLLAGPSRGFVIQELEKNNISYTYLGYKKTHREISKHYHLIDLYLITSRLEGGPKQILEAWSSGIPVVSTNVGMVLDIARHKENALIAESENVESLTSHVMSVFQDPQLRNDLIRQARKDVQNFSWERVARQYDTEILQHLT